jgi:hypothetical protein
VDEWCNRSRQDTDAPLTKSLKNLIPHGVGVGGTERMLESRDYV